MKKTLACLAVVLASGCAGNPRVLEAEQRDAPAPSSMPARTSGDNPGGEAVKVCGTGALGALRAGLIGIPISAGILAVCLPIAAAAAILHEVLPVVPPHVNDGTGAPNFAYPTSAHFDGCRGGGCDAGSPVNDRTGASSFAYPTSAHFSPR